jgi:Ca2+-transporting ATPase
MPHEKPAKAPPRHRFAATAWHTLDADEALRRLASRTSQGISQEEAESRLQEFGLNQLAEAVRVSPWTLLLSQFKNVLIIILLIAAVLSGALGHGVEAGAIGAIVLFAVLLGFAQEFRAERAIEALRKMAAPTATVLRGGEEVEVPANMLVPGDIILLAAGDKVPADARVVESVNLHADEAALTGESVPVQKQTATLQGEKLPVGDLRNMVHAGTIITYGRGRAVVTTTGMQTEFGKIAGLLQTVETSETPLQQNLDRVGKALAKAALVVVFLISCVGILRGQPVLEMIIFGIALAVAVVPEALPAVVTISLAIGVQRMVKRHALVRRLPAVETLGSTSVICSDKTGTLTKDEMTARKVYVARTTVLIDGFGYEPHGEFSLDGRVLEPSSALMDLLTAGALASDATLTKTEDGWDIKGDPTEGALVVAAAKAGLQKKVLDEQFPRTAEIPFTSETKRMTTLHHGGGGETAYAKGAPEILLGSCTLERGEAGTVPLTPERRTEILAAAKQMADDALRVLAVAMKENATLADAESKMTFLGLVGMLDPPRPEAKEAVAKCKAAGIKTIMITGDHPATAMAVAKELGILDGGRAVTGADVDAMDDATFEKAVLEIDVYARVSPAHKLKVVTALQKLGHIVAMTGDGVNDAPALKKADIGIAMGITGTDVTKEAAAMTLTDDNFASIVAAVEEGRGIFGNIKKYLMYLLSSNIGEILLMTGASILGMPLPLTAVQILFVNLATDGLPALALAVDPPEHDLMQRKPRNPRRSIFTPSVIALMVTGGAWSMLINLGLFWWALQSGRSMSEAMTMTFVSLVLIQFFKAYNFRSDHNSILQKPFANTWLNIAVFVEFLLLIPMVYVTAFQPVFDTVALPLDDIIIIGVLSVTIVPVLELAKWIIRKQRGSLAAV